MPRVGFELTIPAFERRNTAHALDGAATVILNLYLLGFLNLKVLHRRGHKEMCKTIKILVGKNHA
jgi:hypothetical protein